MVFTSLQRFSSIDVKSIRQWYEKASFLRVSLQWRKKHTSVQENRRKSLQWRKKHTSAPGKSECWRKNVTSGLEKWRKKHKIEATDVKNACQKSKKTGGGWPELFIADVKLIRQWYRKMQKTRPNIEISLTDVQILRQHWSFFSHLACTDVKNHVSERNSPQWRKNHTSALGKSQRL